MEVLAAINRLVGASAELSTNLVGSAQSLLLVIALVGLATSAIFAAVRGDSPIPTIVTYSLLIGAGVFMIQGWPALVEVVRQGAYAIVGQAGGTGGEARVPAEWGDAIMRSVLNNIEVSVWSPTSWPTALAMVIFAAVAWAAFWISTAIWLYAHLEFALASVLGLVFVPFIAWSPTQYLATRALGGVMLAAAKIIAIGIVVALFGTIGEDLTRLDVGQVLLVEDMLRLVAFAIMLLISVFAASSVASAAAAGSVTLSGGGAAASSAHAAGRMVASSAAAAATRASGAARAMNQLRGPRP